MAYDPPDTTGGAGAGAGVGAGALWDCDGCCEDCESPDEGDGEGAVSGP
jgi:hypothetical protein